MALGLNNQMNRVFESSVEIAAPARFVWKEVTEVDIASFQHPLSMRLLGVPKPLRAKVISEGVGGARVAYFSNGLRFTQQISEWIPDVRYAFSFNADAGFKVGWLLDLSTGPFRLQSGAYQLTGGDIHTRLTLETQYTVSGIFGWALRLPVALVLFIFQRYLLAGIRKNAEREFTRAGR